MSAEKNIIREKLKESYSLIFEEELINEIIEVGTFQSLKNGETLIDIDDEMTHIPLIVEGVIKIMREDDSGDEIALYYLEKGNTCAISFVNCINRNKSMFRGIVTRDAEGIFIPVSKVSEWLQKYESWRRFIIDSYHFRLIEMVESIDRLAFLNLEDRLYKHLIDKVNVTKDTTLIITHQEIADDINTSRVVVSRLLKRLENEGQITIRRNKIIVENLE
ncbi:MAG: Crp/Fnr family transcriptional regulator [Bacteroidetes bacterium]|nr:Crp/Fnr family transcriptional regulator [Bacteroidota bacterium]